MVWIDIVLLIIIIWFAYKGLMNGFIMELIAFIALVLAVIGALKYNSVVKSLLEELFHTSSNLQYYLSFVLTFLIILLAVNLIGRLLTKVIQIVQLGALNRILGFIFAVLKITIILSLTVNGIDRLNNMSHFINKETINNSYLYKPLNGFAQQIYAITNSHFDEISKQLDDSLLEEDTDTTE